MTCYRYTRENDCVLITQIGEHITIEYGNIYPAGIKYGPCWDATVSDVYKLVRSLHQRGFERTTIQSPVPVQLFPGKDEWKKAWLSTPLSIDLDGCQRMRGGKVQVLVYTGSGPIWDEEVLVCDIEMSSTVAVPYQHHGGVWYIPEEERLTGDRVLLFLMQHCDMPKNAGLIVFA